MAMAEVAPGHMMRTGFYGTPAVPAARCSCGWERSDNDGRVVQRAVRRHEQEIVDGGAD